MKKSSFLLLLFAILLAGCAGQKEVQKNVQLGASFVTPCQNETQLNNPNEFLGETVDNLNASQQGNVLAVSFKVRTRCTAQLEALIEKKENKIILKLKNKELQVVQCACYKDFSTTVENLSPGTYEVMVLNADGSQLLANIGNVSFK